MCHCTPTLDARNTIYHAKVEWSCCCTSGRFANLLMLEFSFLDVGKSKWVILSNNLSLPIPLNCIELKRIYDGSYFKMCLCIFLIHIDSVVFVQINLFGGGGEIWCNM